MPTDSRQQPRQLFRQSDLDGGTTMKWTLVAGFACGLALLLGACSSDTASGTTTGGNAGSGTGTGGDGNGSGSCTRLDGKHFSYFSLFLPLWWILSFRFVVNNFKLLFESVFHRLLSEGIWYVLQASEPFWIESLALCA